MATTTTTKSIAQFRIVLRKKFISILSTKLETDQKKTVEKYIQKSSSQAMAAASDRIEYPETAGG